ncbi:MAG TPA: HutP family protein [Candidatus Faecaligallichristensenella faecipullorum]|mgnify:FL=1|nr:HutP family protein [Candidatus Faecaligallichristensenella faecipullorum]
MDTNISGSRTVSRAAVLMCMSRTREEEKQLKLELMQDGVKAAAVDYGGEFISSVMRIVERAVVAAKREGVISDTAYHEEGSVAGATREALSQVMTKAIGLNVGGKIGIARSGNNIAVAIFFGIGLLHLNEVAIGLGHRAI